jgi:hypothetical protein
VQTPKKAECPRIAKRCTEVTWRLNGAKIFKVTSRAPLTSAHAGAISRRAFVVREAWIHFLAIDDGAASQPSAVHNKLFVKLCPPFIPP